MFNTPADCYNYIIENDLEMSLRGAHCERCSEVYDNVYYCCMQIRK